MIAGIRESLGGNQVVSLSAEDLADQGVWEWSLCSEQAPYRFRLVVSDSDQNLMLPVPSVVQVLGILAHDGDGGAASAELLVGGERFVAGDTFNLDDHAVEVRVQSTGAALAMVVASPAVIDRAANDRGPVDSEHEASRRCKAELVNKPWGGEQWLHPEGFGLAVKALTIYAGERTSLQYHRRKHECIFVARGRLRLHHCLEAHDLRSFETDEGEAQEAERPEKGGAAGPELTTTEFEAPVAIEVTPGTLHRLEAIEDLTIVEVSTLDLEDVVRLQDDHGRPDGRVASEHTSKDEACAG